MTFDPLSLVGFRSFLVLILAVQAAVRVAAHDGLVGHADGILIADRFANTADGIGTVT